MQRTGEPFACDSFRTRMTPGWQPSMHDLRCARLGEVAPQPRHRWSLIRAITVDDVFAGVTGLVQSDADNGHDVELISAVLPEFRRAGVATEAGRLFLAAESPPRVHARVLAGISPDNSAARQLASRLGFRETTRVRRTGEVIWVQSETAGANNVHARSVSIVVDPEFGERLASVATHSHVWIADTPTNRTAAERSWASRTSETGVDVTTFKVVEGHSGESWCAEILPTISLHFGAYDDNLPSYDVVDVVGTRQSPRLVELLSGTGHTVLRDFPRGFRASRIAQAVVGQFEYRDWETDLWLMVTPTMRRRDSVQPHLRATSAQAILKNVEGRFAAWQNLSTD